MKQDKNMNRVDRGWTEMEKVLNEHLPQNKRRGFFWIWLIGLFLLGSLSGFALVKWNQTQKENEAHKYRQSFMADSNNDKIKDDSKYIDRSLDGEAGSTEVNEFSTLVNKSNEKSFPNIQNTTSNETQNETRYVSGQDDVGDSFNSTIGESHNYAKKKKEVINTKSQLNETKSTKINPVALNELKPISTMNEEAGFLADGISFSSETTESASETANENLKVVELTKIGPALVSSAQTVDSKTYNINFKSITPNSSILPQLVEPISRNKEIRRWSYGLFGIAEHQFNFDRNGFGGGLFAQREINSVLSVGARIGYVHHAVANQDEDARAELQDPSGLENNPEDMNVFPGNLVLIDAENAIPAIKSETRLLNSIMGELYLNFSPISRLAFTTGIGLERYFNRVKLIESLDENLLSGLNPEAKAYGLEESQENVSYTHWGLSYRITEDLSLFAQYKHPLDSFANFQEQSLSTNKAIVGLSYALN